MLLSADGLLRGKACSWLCTERTLRLTSYSSTVLSERMSQKGFTHLVHSTRWPFFPCILRGVQNQFMLLFSSKLGKWPCPPWLLISRLNKASLRKSRTMSKRSFKCLCLLNIEWCLPIEQEKDFFLSFYFLCARYWSLQAQERLFHTCIYVCVAYAKDYVSVQNVYAVYASYDLHRPK